MKVIKLSKKDKIKALKQLLKRSKKEAEAEFLTGLLVGSVIIFIITLIVLEANNII